MTNIIVLLYNVNKKC